MAAFAEFGYEVIKHYAVRYLKKRVEASGEIWQQPSKIDITPKNGVFFVKFSNVNGRIATVKVTPFCNGCLTRCVIWS